MLMVFISDDLAQNTFTSSVCYNVKLYTLFKNSLSSQKILMVVSIVEIELRNGNRYIYTCKSNPAVYNY
jgi:hypothetical protein